MWACKGQWEHCLQVRVHMASKIGFFGAFTILTVCYKNVSTQIVYGAEKGLHESHTVLQNSRVFLTTEQETYW